MIIENFYVYYERRIFNQEVFKFTMHQEDREEADYGFYLILGKEVEIIIDGAETFLRECETGI